MMPVNSQPTSQRNTFSKTWLRATRVAAVACALFSAGSAQAYFSTVDTGDLVAPQKFQAIVEPQLILNKYDGLNVVGRFDTGLNESSSVRGILGFGKVDFQLGALYKYIPFPDLPGQPAIGGEAGAVLARVDGKTEFSLRLHPLVSKKFETEIGDVTPYASIPFGVTSRSGDETFVPVQVEFGAEVRPLNLQSLSFFGEFGINVNKSFSYISAAVAWRFDEDTMRVK